MRRVAACIVAIVAACVPLAAAARTAHDAQWAEVEVAFTPGDDVESLIVRRIGAARGSVRMQAYLFTNPRIARALFSALHRGIPVEVIGDARQYADGGLPWLDPLARAGARVYLDESAAASHNKIVIVDGEGAGAAVITGSYNFTRSAQERNAENVVLLRGNRAIAGRFVASFRARRAESRPLEPGPRQGRRESRSRSD